MEQQAGDLLSPLTPFLVQGQEFLSGLLVPWRFYQVVILVSLFLVAFGLEKWLGPKVNQWMRSLKGMQPYQLRVLLVLSNRLRGLIFLALSWPTYWILKATTWSWRSDLIGIVVTLASIWIFVAVATRLMRAGLLRSVVKWSAWIYGTIQILDIEEEVTSLLDQIGVTLGGTRLTALLVVQAAVTLAVTVMLAFWASRFIRRRLEGTDGISPSIRVLVDKVLSVIFYGIAVVVGLQVIGFDLTSLTVLSGAIGLGIGFGLQKVVSNLLSGVIVLLDKSIKPGDVISLGDTFGWVSELNARFVGVNTRDGREYLIPNEDLITTQVVNWSHSSDLIRLDIHFGTSYASDPHHVRALAREAAASVKRVVSDPSPVCHITGFGDSSVDFILRFWIRDPASGLTNVRGDVFLALWDALKEHQIEIPFPRRDVTITERTGATPTLSDD